MFSLVYRSIASPKLNQIQIKELHMKAMSFNQKNEITGCLMHHHGKFVQLLEGPKNIIIELFEKIKKDPNHTEVRILHTQFSSARMFNDWSMIYDDLDIITSKEVLNKRRYFEHIYHSSDAAYTPGHSKLEFWREINNAFQENYVNY